MSEMYDFVRSQAPVSYEIDAGRLASAQKFAIPPAAWVRSVAPSNAAVPNAVIYQAAREYQGSGKNPYKLQAVAVRNGSTVQFWLGCTCPDWIDAGGWAMDPPRLCKHLLAWAEKMDLPPVKATFKPVKTNPLTSSGAGTPIPEEEPLPPMSFPDLVKHSIERAVRELADQIWSVTQSGAVPFLIGPTGCGKTSANRLLAIEHNMAFVEHAGSDAWTESDLVGIVHTNGQKFPGPIANACEWATNGQKIHLLLDEFPRNNRRVQDGLMRFLLTTPGKIAEAMGVPCNRHDIHITSAPFWGDAWACADDISICLAGNPWGTDLDPALIRRTEPIRVGFDDSILAHFSKRIQVAVSTSWTAVAQGDMALPIEYQAMTKAKGPDDLGLVASYVSRLAFLDAAGADGYVSTLEGLSVGITRQDLEAALPPSVRNLGLPGAAEAPVPF